MGQCVMCFLAQALHGQLRWSHFMDNMDSVSVQRCHGSGMFHAGDVRPEKKDTDWNSKLQLFVGTK